MGADDLLADLRQAVGGAHVLTDGPLRAGYETDWTGRFRGRALAVVRPGDPAEVARVVAACAAAGVAVVPQGGNTGLVGGSVPTRGGVVLSLRRLDRIEPVDLAAAQVTAQAGVTVAALDAAAAAHDLTFGLDLASRDSATVGGVLATNAGGVHVLRWGPAREQVAGIEAVLADGTVVSHLSGLVKDNTGYDLTRLLVGSEGTLAVITAARLVLRPRLHGQAAALVALPGSADAVALAALARRDPALFACEALWEPTVGRIADRLGRRPPVGPPPGGVLVLLGFATEADDGGALARLAAVVDAAGVDPDRVAVADDAHRRAALWQWREAAAEAIAAGGVPLKFDVTVPLGAIPRFAAEVVDAVADAAGPMAKTLLFGHLGDGNIHVNVLGAADDGAVDEAVLTCVAAHGGSISAEHGIGTAKVGWLHLSRSPAEVAVFRRIKAALDPAGILNPGVLLPPAGGA